jgi:UDP:flavonoid glycosyltransferase YjiC (YdhE family)
MSTKKVIFISPPAYGHLIKTELIAKYYADKGYGVHYFVNGDNPSFFRHHPFSYTVLKSKALGLGKEFNPVQYSAKFNKWFSFIVQHIAGKKFYARKNEIEAILVEHQPDIVFLDEFSASDFLFIYPFFDSLKCIVLTPFLPSLPNGVTPPINVFASTNVDVAALWRKQQQKVLKMQRAKKINYLFQDQVSVIKRAFKKQNIPLKYQPDFCWESMPHFPHLEKWYLQPYEIDFVKQDLPAYQKYMGPMIDLNRHETLDPRYTLFLKYANAASTHKVVFCSLGSVITALVKDEQKLIHFYNTIAEVAAENLHCFFAVKIPAPLIAKVKPLSVNFFVFKDIPYLAILKRADVFITHCGGNCYLESIYMETPMLAVPPVNRWDYNGNAVRVSYHQLGLNASLNDSVAVFNAKLDELFSNEKYTSNIKKMSALLHEKYPVNYLDMEEMP